jgi:hypothetical protein
VLSPSEFSADPFGVYRTDFGVVGVEGGRLLELDLLAGREFGADCKVWRRISAGSPNGAAMVLVVVWRVTAVVGAVVTFDKYDDEDGRFEVTGRPLFAS